MANTFPLQTRDSHILKPCARFSGLFSAISPESTKPWFTTCPNHELSGFNPHDSEADTVSSTVPAKRPADTPTEHRSQRLKMDVSSQAITPPPSTSAGPSAMPCQPPMTYTTPTIPQVRAPDSTIQPPSCEAQCAMGDKPVWLGNLVWPCGGSELGDVRVQATYPIRDLGTSKWPTSLRLVIVEAGISTLDVQAHIQRHKVAVARFQCLPGIDNQHFGGLVKTLREGKCVAVVQLEIEIQDKGSLKLDLVLAPLHEGLTLCSIPRL